MNNLKNKQPTGFGLIELIVAMGLFLVFSVSGITTVLHSYTVNRLSDEEANATLLAEEGIEAVQSIKKESWSNLSPGTYGLDSSGGSWDFSGTSETIDKYTREITISTIDSNTYKIDSTVSWDFTPTRNNSVDITTYLTNFEQYNGPAFRVDEYYIDSGFTGTDYTLTLNNDLESNYFVFVQGSDGDGNTSYGPNDVQARLVSDPFGTGDLATSAAANQIGIRRGSTGSTGSWTGVITVVECLGGCDTKGFQLLDVKDVTHLNADTSGNTTISSTWTDLNQVMIMGGFNGSGCETAETSDNNFKVCHARIYPSGTNQINWTRDTGGATLSTANSTVMAIEWGSNWTVQRVNITGTNGGNGVDSTGEYNTASLTTPVNRDNTWVWGAGHTDDNGIGDAAEGAVITLGDGVNQNTTENTVAMGLEYNQTNNFEVYVLTHDNLIVDYRFKADGDSNNLTYDQTVDNFAGATERMALVTNGTNGTGTAYPRPHFSARFLNDTTVQLERRRSGQQFPAWIQAIDFSNI